jgi:hypothetical protein
VSDQLENPDQFVINLRHENSKPRSRKKFELYRLAVANQDISHAVNTCDELLKIIFAKETGPKLPYHLREAFFSTIIVSYARPFMDNDSNLKLPKEWSKFSNKGMQDTHLHMLELRNQLYGHSDADANRMIIMPAGYDSKQIGRKIPRTSWMFHTFVPAHESILGFRATAADLQKRLEADVSSRIEELYDGMDLPNKPFRLNRDSEGL